MTTKMGVPLQPLSEAPLQRSVRLVIDESHKDVDAFEVNLVGVVETARRCGHCECGNKD
jgi:hypothetical protein